MDKQVCSFLDIEKILEKLNNTKPIHSPLECIKNIKLTQDESLKLPKLLKYFKQSRQILQATNEKKAYITDYEHLTQIKGIVHFYNQIKASMSNQNQQDFIITNKYNKTNNFWHNTAFMVQDLLPKYKQLKKHNNQTSNQKHEYDNLKNEQKCFLQKMQNSLILGDIQILSNQLKEKDDFGDLQKNQLDRYIDKFVPEFSNFITIKEDMMDLLKKNDKEVSELAKISISESCLLMMGEIKKRHFDCVHYHLDENDQQLIKQCQLLIMKGKFQKDNRPNMPKESIISIVKPIYNDYAHVKKIWNIIYKVVGYENKFNDHNRQNMAKQAYDMVQEYMTLLKKFEKDFIKKSKQKSKQSSSSLFGLIKNKNKVKNDHSQSNDLNSNPIQQANQKNYFDQLNQQQISTKNNTKLMKSYSQENSKQKQIRQDVEQQIYKSVAQKGFSIKKFQFQFKNTKQQKSFQQNLIFFILSLIEKDLGISGQKTIFSFLQQREQYLNQLYARILQLKELLIPNDNKIAENTGIKHHQQAHQEDETQNQTYQFMNDSVTQILANIKNEILLKNKKIGELEKTKQTLDSFKNTYEINQQSLNAKNIELQQQINTNNDKLSDLIQKLNSSQQSLDQTKQQLANKEIDNKAQVESNQKYLAKVLQELEWANAEITNEEITPDGPKISIQQIKNKIDSQLESLKKNVFKTLNKDKLKFGQQYATKIQKCVEDYFGKDQVLKYSLLFSTFNGGDINSLTMGIPNTLTIIKTQHANLIACFSSLSHCGKFDGQKSKGFIMSNTLNKCFGLKEGQKALKANKQQIIFGNDEIVLNKNESGFKNCQVIMKGSDSVFEVGETKNNEFSMVASNDLLITGFEIYEVTLKNFIRQNVEAPKEQIKKDLSQKKKRKSKSKEKSLEKIKKDDKDKIERYKNTIAKLKEENQQLYKNISTLQNKISLQTQKMSESEETNISENPSKSQKSKQQSQRYAKEQRIEQLEAKLAQMMENQKQAQKEMQQKAKRIQDLSQQQKKFNQMFVNIEKQKQQLKESLKIIQSQQSQTPIQRDNEQKHYENEICELKMEIKKLQQEIERIKACNKEMKEQMNEYMKVGKKTEQIEKMTALVEGLKKQIEIATKTVTDLKQEQKQYEQKQKSRNQIQQDVSKLRQMETNLRRTLSILENKKEIAERNAKILQKENQKYEQLVKKVEKLKSESKSYEEQNQKAAKLIDEQKEKTKAMVEDMQRNKQTIGKVQQKIEQLKQQQQKLQSSIQCLTGQSLKLKEKQGQVTAEIEEAQKKLGKQNDKLDSIQKDYEQKQNFLKLYEQKRAKIEGINEALEISQKNWAKFQSKRDRLDEETKCKQKKLQQVQAKFKQLIKKESQHSGVLNKFFVGSVIDYDEDKKFIVDELFKHYPSKNITKTKLLFAYPLMHGLDPHLFVDNKEHYILLIKMSVKDEKSGKNFVIACYSQMPLVSKGPRNDGVGFVSSVTSEKTFYLTKNNLYNPHWTQYDQYHFIYGNSEIRFKINQTKIETNIGHNFKSLQTGALKSPQIFTGEKTESSIMESYQIFQIIFE